MRINEIVDAQAQLELWKLVSTSVWQAIEQQRAEHERAQATAAQQRASKKPSKSSKRGAAVKPTAGASVKKPNVSPQSTPQSTNLKQSQFNKQTKHTDVNADVGNTQLHANALTQPTPANHNTNPQLATKQKAEPPQLSTTATPALQLQAPGPQTQNTQHAAPKRTPLMRQLKRNVGV